MNEARVARWRMLGGRWLRSLAGGTVLASFWMFVVTRGYPNAFSGSSFLCVVFATTYAFYVDLSRPSGIRPMKGLTKSAYRLSKKALWLTLFIFLVLKTDWKSEWAHLASEPNIDKTWNGLALAYMLLLVSAALSVPIVLPILAMLDRWQEKDEEYEGLVPT